MYKMNSKKDNSSKSMPDQNDTLRHEIKQIEKEFILKALDEARNDKNLAAQNLGISTKLLVEKMHELDIL